MQVRQAEQDVVLGGYRIPKGTVVVTDAIGQRMDELHFPEPEVLFVPACMRAHIFPSFVCCIKPANPSSDQAAFPSIYCTFD